MFSCSFSYIFSIIDSLSQFGEELGGGEWLKGWVRRLSVTEITEFSEKNLSVLGGLCGEAHEIIHYKVTKTGALRLPSCYLKIIIRLLGCLLYL
jgi:hypothetical protein